jgi:hypothetical protein
MIPLLLVLAQAALLYSDPSERVCTPESVSTATVQWDAVSSPRVLQFPDGNRAWILTQYEASVATSRQHTTVYVPSSTLETTFTITPPAVVCTEVRSIGELGVPTGGTQLGIASNLRFTNPPPPLTTTVGWSALTVPTALDARGYFWRLPRDPVSKGFMIYMGSPDSSSIYSKDIWRVDIRTGAFTKVIGQTGNSSEELCPKSGAPVKNPGPGHPLGLMWVDPVVNIFYMTGPLCANYNEETTSRLDLTTNTMLPKLATWPMWSGGSIGMDSGFEYVASYAKAMLCCGDNAHATTIYEFDRPSGTYVDVSAMVRGMDGVACDYNISYPNPISLHCPVLLQGAATHSDGTYLWIFGGWQNAVGTTELFKYDPVTKIVLRISPTSGIKPPADHGAWPLSFFDSNRNRIVFLAQTGELWQYVLATNTWSQFTASGNGPILNVEPYPGRACNFDAEVDKAICVISEGQSKPPVAYVLTFTGQQPTK